MSRLANKVAVVTGGASGIGEATVRLFVDEGAQVVVADIQDDKGQQLAEALGASATYIHTDVTSEQEIHQAIEQAVRQFGRLDIMFNNAGFPGPSGPIEELTAAEFDTVIAVLLRSAFFGMKHAAPVMKQQGSGSIISTASIAGLGTGYAGHLYSVAKAGVIHLTRTIAMELGEQNIRVNCICPGGIATAIFGRAFGLDIAAADQTVEAMKQVLAHAQAIPRAGLPHDIAQAALWLASDDSSFVNGQALVVDGSGGVNGLTWTQAQVAAGRMAQAMGITSPDSV